MPLHTRSQSQIVLDRSHTITESLGRPVRTYLTAKVSDRGAEGNRTGQAGWNRRRELTIPLVGVRPSRVARNASDLPSADRVRCRADGLLCLLPLSCVLLDLSPRSSGRPRAQARAATVLVARVYVLRRRLLLPALPGQQSQEMLPTRPSLPRLIRGLRTPRPGPHVSQKPAPAMVLSAKSDAHSGWTPAARFNSHSHPSSSSTLSCILHLTPSHITHLVRSSLPSTSNSSTANRTTCPLPSVRPYASRSVHRKQSSRRCTFHPRRPI